MDRVLRTTALIGFLAPIVAFAPLAPAKAGFLDWLFGGSPARMSAPAHPDVAVHAARRLAHRTSAKRAAPKPPALAIDPKDTLARTINPSKNPDWWLTDPTLRRGDVLFLADRVVVFVGGTPGRRASYVPVSGTRLVSARERRQILAMAGDRVVAKTRLVAARPKPEPAPMPARVAALR